MKNFLLLILTFNFALLTFNFASAQTTYEGTNVPYIHPRIEWLTTPELRNLFSWYPYSPKEEGEIPDYYPIRQIILHDTGCNPSRPGCNDESIPTPTLIQNIFRFHAVTRGWGDIGYHFIIDRNGEIWEGRYGGNGVRGAHLYNQKTCQNFNVGSVGITLIGNYYDASIPPKMMESLKRLSAWIAFTNDITLNEATSFQVWTNKKDEKGNCVAESKEKGRFSTTFTGLPLLTHREVEPANSDIRNINLAFVRDGAVAYLEEFKTYAFQEQGNATIFEFVQVKLRALTTTGKKLVSILKTQLDYFRPELFARKPEPKVTSTPQLPTFPDGTLVRGKEQEDVYLIKDQKRIHISSAALFNGLGLKWENIKEEEKQIVTNLSSGSPIVFPNGILLQAQTPDVYYITNQKRYLVSSPELFNAYQFNWEDIVQITLNELDRYYPWGGYVKWPEGSVLQNIYNKNQVVVVKSNTIEPVNGSLSSETPVYAVNGRELSSYQSAQVVTPTLTLSLSQAYTSVKQALGLETGETEVTTESPHGAMDGNNTPATNQQQETTPPSSNLANEPIIKIALCKTRVKDINQCPFNPEDVLEFVTNDQGITTVNGYEDRPGFNTSLNDNQFRGKLSTIADSEGKVWLINELPLEEYLKGIAETLGTDAPEYRKALITMARTYAYFYLTQQERYPGKSFHLTNVSFDQLYRGYNYELRSNGLPEVIEATRGQIIRFNEKPIVAAYSSDSGGVTKNACNVFPKYCDANGNLMAEFAYLRGGIADPEGTIHNQAKIDASHGVGVSTTGARRLIELGKTWQEVITYYYPGVEIQQIY